MTRPSLDIAVGIATVGRPEILATTLRHLTAQDRPANRILIAPASDADVAGLDLAAYGAERVAAPRGLCAQRNAILRSASSADVIIFFDDDFFPCADYLGVIERAFLDDPGMVMATGAVIRDGIVGPGLDTQSALAILDQAPRSAAAAGKSPVFNGYGCNMAFRLEPVRAGVYFDERLPLYGWLEDVDFSRRIAGYGAIMRLEAARGVHLGAKVGRQSGRRLGYSQVSNPLYLSRKGSLPLSRALHQILRNVAMNIVKAPTPEPYVDRRGRLQGNFLAVRDALRGELAPERAMTLT